MNSYDHFFEILKDTHLSKALPELKIKLDLVLNQRKNGNFDRWRKAYDQLPDVTTQHAVLNQSVVSVGRQEELSEAQREVLLNSLRQLCPWRKGPFSVFDIHIETEWHSDWKWDRLIPHIAPLQDKLVLDVGCGSGYHSWRMAGEGARLVMGIDPSLLFVMQYKTIKKYAGDVPAFVLPFALEDMPHNTPCFDTVFSMGVLYHRRSPFDHIQHLYSLLKPEGELVLETLIIEGEENQVLVPRDRYAKMRNVWFIPSVPELIKWLERFNFKNVRCVDINQTSVEEQRATDWMQLESLPNFLNPDNHDLTIEGYPAPRRAVILANK